MNNKRRQALQKIIDLITTAQEDVEDLRDEEEEYRDNIPESLRASQVYTTADEAADQLQEAADALADTIENLQSAQGEQ